MPCREDKPFAIGSKTLGNNCANQEMQLCCSADTAGLVTTNGTNTGNISADVQTNEPVQPKEEQVMTTEAQPLTSIFPGPPPSLHYREIHYIPAQLSISRSLLVRVTCVAFFFYILAKNTVACQSPQPGFQFPVGG